MARSANNTQMTLDFIPGGNCLLHQSISVKVRYVTKTHVEYNQTKLQVLFIEMFFPTSGPSSYSFIVGQMHHYVFTFRTCSR